MSGSDKKRSWRQKPSSEPDSDATPAPAPAAGGDPNDGRTRVFDASVMGSKRFRGGKSVVKTHHQHSSLVRIFVPVTALFVIMIMLGVMLWWFAGAGLSPKPLLIAWSVTDYDSRLIPPNDFAYEDVRRVQSTKLFVQGDKGISQNTANMQTDRDFKLFFDRSLPAVENEVVVVYLSAHGVSDDQGAYFLTSEASADSNTGRYPLSQVLRQTAACKAKNKLLILDSTRFDANLDLGILGNDFVYYLRKEFAALKKELETAGSTQNFWVICSSDEGQIAWASASLKHSIFGLSVAYCLNGGSEVDRPDERGKRDLNLSASEVVDFIEQRVASWAPKYRNAVQKPFHLSIGKDFHLISVDEGINAAAMLAVLTPPEMQQAAAKKDESKDGKDAKGTEEKAEKKDDPKAEKKDAPPPPPAVEPLTVEKVTAKVMDGWKERERLENSLSVARRPIHWAEFQQLLIRAERLLIAGQLEHAMTLIDRPIAELIAELSLPSDWPKEPAWSLAFRDPANEKDPLNDAYKEFQKVLAKPVEADLAAVRKSRVVEADLIAMLARHFRDKEEWIDPDLVSFALDARILSVSGVRRLPPDLMTFVHDPLIQGDASRRQGEAAIYVRRLPEARAHFRRAVADYRRAESDAEEIDKQFARVQQAVGNVPHFIRWLGADPPEREGRIADIRKLSDFLRRIQEFEERPDRERLRVLANVGEDLANQAEDYAENAGQVSAWRQTWAALQLPFLQPRLRAELLAFVLRPKADGSPLESDFRRDAPFDANRPADPFPLVEYLKQLDAGPKLLEPIERLDPINRETVTLEQVMKDPATRELRAVAGSRLRELWQKMRNSSRTAASDDTGERAAWKRAIRHRLTADFHGEVSVTAEDPVLLALHTQSLIQEMQWQATRLAADNAYLPGSFFDSAINMLTTALRNYNPDYRLTSMSPTFTLEGETRFVVPEGGGTSFPLAIKQLRPLPQGGGKAKLILDWHLDRDIVQFELDGRTSSEGLLVDALPPMEVDNLQRLPLIIRRLGQVSEERTPRVTARVELPDGTLNWLPFAVYFKPPEVRPAELVLTWKDRAGRDDRVELYPNQTFPVTLAIRKNVPTPLDLRLEFQSGEAPIGILNFTGKEGQTGVIPLTAPAGWETAVELGDLAIRLFKDETPLDEKRLRVDVLDPTDFLKPSVQYDSQTRFLTVRVERLEPSDAADGIPLALELPGMTIVEGVMAAALPGDQNQATLDAKIPPAYPDRDFPVLVSAAGVPRAFRYGAGSNRPQGRVVKDLALSIVEPKDRIKFAPDPNRAELPVLLHVDGPDTDVMQTYIGLDRNSNGTLEAGERRGGGQFRAGRDVRVRLAFDNSKPEKPEFVLRTKVTDVNITIPAAGLLGPQNVLANVLVGNQTKTSAALVYFLTGTPTIDLDGPLNGTEVEQGQPLNVVVKGDPVFFAAIDKLVFGVDVNSNGQLDPTDIAPPIGVAPGEAVRFGSSDRLTVKLPTDKLLLGRNLLLVQAETTAIDPKTGKMASYFSPYAQRSFFVIPPTKAMVVGDPGKEKPPEFGKIKGKVLIGPTGKKGAKVVIPGVGETMSGDDGAFAFDNVKPGAYPVSAEGYQRVGSGAVTVEAGKEANVEIPLSLK